jgi:hypothetical protein
VTDDERRTSESEEASVDRTYRPMGALFVTIVLGTVIVVGWALMYWLAQVRG